MDQFPSEFPPDAMLEELGRGTTGVVFAVRDPCLNRDMALKAVAIMNEDERPVRTARFLREARVLAYLTSGPHEDIPKLHAVNEHEGRGYYLHSGTGGRTDAGAGGQRRHDRPGGGDPDSP